MPTTTILDWEAKGNGVYRVLAVGWWADVVLGWDRNANDCNGGWTGEVLATNSTLAEHEIIDAALIAINGAN